jgi:hypothetical protein
MQEEAKQQCVLLDCPTHNHQVQAIVILKIRPQSHQDSTATWKTAQKRSSPTFNAHEPIKKG